MAGWCGMRGQAFAGISGVVYNEDMEPQTTPPENTNPTPTPPLAPAPPAAPVPPNSTLSSYPMPPKKSKKKVVLIVVAVIVVLIGLLSLVPAPPEEQPKPETAKIARAQPAGTKLERFANQKVDIAIPDGWTKSEDIALQNVDNNSDTESELAKSELYALYYDEAYTASDEQPTISLNVSDHGYVDDKAAIKKVDELEKAIGDRNGHGVVVKKEKVQVGKFSQYEAYLYTYEDTFDSTTTEKLKRYELFVAAHDNYYQIHAHVPLLNLEKYDELVKRSVLSLNPDE